MDSPKPDKTQYDLMILSFSSFRNIAFFAGSILAVMLVLSFIDQDVLTAEHVISFMAMLGKTLSTGIIRGKIGRDLS